MKVLMIGVSSKRLGGMWTVAEQYLKHETFCKETDLRYIATSTNGNIMTRIFFMLYGFTKIFMHLLFARPDLVHVHMAEKGSVYRKGFAVKMAKGFGCKVIIHMHAGPFMDWYGSQTLKKQSKILRILNRADKILILGEFWKKQMQAIIPAKKLEVLYNGIVVPSKNGYCAENLNIIYMGVLKKEKGIYDLLEAIKMIDDDLDKQIKVQLCGIDLEGDIKEKISLLDLTERIHLNGWLENEEKQRMMQSARLNVLPSYYEGLSMSVIEAMSYGIPTITTDISTMHEILGDEVVLIQSGNVKQLADRIKICCTDMKLLEKESEIVYQRACNFFDIEKNVERLKHIYENLLLNG